MPKQWQNWHSTEWHQTMQTSTLIEPLKNYSGTIFPLEQGNDWRVYDEEIILYSRQGNDGIPSTYLLALLWREITIRAGPSPTPHPARPGRLFWFWYYSILNFEFWILNLESWILNPESWILNPNLESWIFYIVADNPPNFQNPNFQNPTFKNPTFKTQ